MSKILFIAHLESGTTDTGGKEGGYNFTSPLLQAEGKTRLWREGKRIESYSSTASVD